MGSERLGTEIECDAIYGPVLSSERAPHFKMKKCSDQEKEVNNLVMYHE
jgi:hypothetical protein